jgi:hypothetical protein
MRDRSRGFWASALRKSSADALEQDSFAGQVATPLQARERTDPAFAERVMRAVREEARRPSEQPASIGRRSPWYRRSVAVRVTPIGGLVLAAGLATLMVVGADLLSTRDRPTAQSRGVAERRDTVHVVRFVFVAPGAANVAVVGDFNGWDPKAHRLTPVGGAGLWSASVPLTPGRHEYAFVIDGKRWVADPAATSVVADEFGGQSSLITVGRFDSPLSS